MFRLDYKSCFLTVVATVLVSRKNWMGLLLSGVNSVIGVHTSQYGFIPANLFCICIHAFNIRAWRKLRKGHSVDESASMPGLLRTQLNRVTGAMVKVAHAGQWAHRGEGSWYISQSTVETQAS